MSCVNIVFLSRLFGAELSVKVAEVTKAVIDVRNFERDKEVWEKPENYVR